jgi:hypothetical protein
MWRLQLLLAACSLAYAEETTCSFPAMVPATMQTYFGKWKRTRSRAGTILLQRGDNCYFFTAEDDRGVISRRSWTK